MPQLTSFQHRRTHNLLLISKLLSSRDAASPFTLILDSLAQSGKPLIREYIRRSNAAKVRVVYVSFETLKKPRGVDVFHLVASENASRLRKAITGYVQGPQNQRTLLVIDSLNTICNTPSFAPIPAFLSSLLSPTTSLLASFHTDIPPQTSIAPSPYSPQPLTLLKYLATTLLVLHSLTHVLLRKSARDRSLAEPVFGLEEDFEGTVVGIGSNDSRGLVIEMEHRRKSGRGVREWFFLLSEFQSLVSLPPKELAPQLPSKDRIILLEDHPLYLRVPNGQELRDLGPETPESTFDLGLTEKQRREREGVVLPYFDAQKEGGGDGGRILYQMGVEDDFDEEEDEI